MRALLVGLAVAAALGFAAPALASDQHPTLAEIEGEVMCPVCPGETLDESTAPAADRERALIRSLIAKGYTKSEIEQRLVDEYGPQILAAPPKHGFNLLAWVLPIAGVIGGALALGYLAWRWSHGRAEPEPSSRPAAADGGPERPIEPELEQRLDEELARFDA
jgi:cytochrome c-type biogenesis protein CcmH